MSAREGADTSTVEAIADMLRAGIRNGRYMPGQRLVEVDLTRELGVSRGPLREALRRLAAENLVDLQHHRGASVRHFTRAEAAAVYDVREVLEALAARLAARRIAERARSPAPLVALVRKMAASLEAGAIGAYIEQNQAFHDLLVEWSENPQLGHLVRQLQVPLFRLQLRSLIDLAALRKSHLDHVQIAEAVAAGDEAAAERSMRRHVRRSGAETRRLPDDAFSAEAGDGGP